ncbi:hypothetical protein TWF481_004536 [Arthrobotrys musiformis]|uniref:Fido domain-containing protein n=1 Tax=Arthrobotrys musiformis TaxID=47236 RepID=A0AAV9WLX9_9PEZI
MKSICIWDFFPMPDPKSREKCESASIQEYTIPPWFDPDLEVLKSLPTSLREASSILSTFYEYNPADDFEKHFVEYIFFSNAIEQAGLDEQQTRDIVKKMLGGESIETDESVPLRSSNSYSQNEVTQHVKAYFYLQNSLSKNLLDESILLETHRILTQGIPAMNGEQGYQGKYREVAVQVGRPSVEKVVESPVATEEVRPMMAKWIEDFRACQQNAPADLIAVAAELKLQFVHIHPFLDGNGRMSRMLFNSLLNQHYPYILCIFGEDARERTRYQHAIGKAIDNDRKIFSFYVLRRTVKSVVQQLGSVAKLSSQASALIETFEKILQNK